MPVCSGPCVSWWGLLLCQFPKGNPWCPTWRKGNALGMLGAQLGRDSVGSRCPLAQPWDLSLWLFNPLEVSLSFCLCGGSRGQIGGPGVQPGLHPIQQVPPAHQRGVPFSRCLWSTRGAQVLGALGEAGLPAVWTSAPQVRSSRMCRVGCRPLQFPPSSEVMPSHGCQQPAISIESWECTFTWRWALLKQPPKALWWLTKTHDVCVCTPSVDLMNKGFSSFKVPY